MIGPCRLHPDSEINSGSDRHAIEGESGAIHASVGRPANCAQHRACKRRYKSFAIVDVQDDILQPSSMHHQAHLPSGTHRRQMDCEHSALSVSAWRPARFAARFIAVILVGSLIAGIHYAFSDGEIQLQAIGHGYETSNASTTCRDVRSARYQCAFVRSHCQDEDDGLISYLQLYYCSLPHLKALAWIIILLWIALLFTSIGICAESFFSVNLSFIARALHMSDTFAGVTLLALGNGAPDLFSTWASMASGISELAIGELIGAASFISTVVAGSIALIGPFYIRKISFARDAFFLTLTALLLLPVLVTKKLYLWQGLVMIGLYIIYVSCVVGYHWWSRSRAPSVERAQARPQNHERTPLLPGYSSDHDPSQLTHRDHRANSREGLAVYKEMNGWRRRHRMVIEARDDYFIQPSLIASLEYRHRKRNAKRQERAVEGTTEDETPPVSDHTKDFGARHIYETLFPTLRDVGRRESWHALLNLCTTIPFFLMKITIPVAESDQEDHARCQSPEQQGWDR